MFDGSIFSVGPRVPAYRASAASSGQPALAVTTQAVTDQLNAATLALAMLDGVVKADVRQNLHACAPAPAQVMGETIQLTEYAITDLHWNINTGKDVPMLADGINILCERITKLRTLGAAAYPSVCTHYGKAVGAVSLACIIAGVVALAARITREPAEALVASICAGTMAGVGTLLVVIATLREGRHILEVDRALTALDRVAKSLADCSAQLSGGDRPVAGHETTPLLGNNGNPDVAPPGKPPHPLFYA